MTNVHSTDAMGGVELHVLQVSRELVRRGHQVDLLFRSPGSLEAEYRTFCRTVTRVPEVDYWYPPGRRGRPKQMAMVVPAAVVAACCRPDIVYGNRISSTGWAIPAAKVARAPLVCHEHGHSDHLSDRRIAFLNRHVDRLILVSRFVADRWVASGIDPDKIDVIVNGIDPAEYGFGGTAERAAARRLLGLDDEQFVVVYVGRLDREKGVHVLLRAWQELGLGPGEARLVVVGSPTVDHDADRYRAELTAAAGDGVTFLAGRRDVVTPLHAADVVVVPSVWQEPFGRTVIEALSTGRPVVASRVGGIPEIMTGPLERMLFEAEDAAGLAAQLHGLRGWQEREPGLAQQCRNRVLDRFSLDRMVDGIEATFRSVG
ncbi:MAG TPA: glycosyltransferase family 4 protein [Acidimicrobiales bacterium]|nr:glycosyltransferase family 4 protein [Acidimicrobiales bacterium]